MKYLLSLVLGLMLGVAAAGALLYFNPLTRRQERAAPDADWVLSYSLAGTDTWISTHDERLDLPVLPKGVPLLWETGIKGMLLAAMPLEDAGSDLSAAGTRISVPSTQTEFLRAGLLVDDFWLISVPGRGSIFVHAVNNQWPLLRDTVVKVNWLHRSWSGPGEYGPTRGPEATGAEVVGMTGEYAGARGRGRERLSLDSYSGSLAELSGELRLDVADARR